MLACLSNHRRKNSYLGFRLIIYRTNPSYRDVSTILNVDSCALLKPPSSKTLQSPCKAWPDGCSAQVALVSKC